MHVQVGHTLADSVVDGHEAALGTERGLHQTGHALGPVQQRTERVDGDIRERVVVGQRDHQHVSGEQRRSIEERHGRFVTEDLERASTVGDDLTEHARSGHHTPRVDPREGATRADDRPTLSEQSGRFRLIAVLVPRYGLDIETDTSVDGLDPAVAAIVSVAVVGEGPAQVIDGTERVLLGDLDDLLAALAPGILVTWNGGGFDLPFLHHRAARLGIRLGLRLRHDPRIIAREPLAGCPGVFRACWYQHRHLDGYRVYRADVGASLGLSCGLKSLARAVGLDPIEVDRERIHELSPSQLHDYVASDAVLARTLVDRRWASAKAAVDDPAFVDAEPHLAAAVH